jgi:chromosome partitioning protein
LGEAERPTWLQQNIRKNTQDMEIIAVYNPKGGVGKTTTAVNLAFRSAADDWPTVLWDLDPQGAATYLLRREPDVTGSAKDLARGETALKEVVVATDHPRLDLVPAAPGNRRLEGHLQGMTDAATRLVRLMRPLQARYACLVLDCPPGLSLVAENVMHGADALVVPLIPSALSVRVLEELLQFVGERGWRDLKVLPFFSMVDRRRALHRATIEELRARFPEILATEVPYGSEFERMAARRAPIEAYAPANAAAAVYRALWQEIDARLNAVASTRVRRGVPMPLASATPDAEIADTDIVGSPWSG